MAELADALDSGSSEHYAHASSSLVIRITKIVKGLEHLQTLYFLSGACLKNAPDYTKGKRHFTSDTLIPSCSHTIQNINIVLLTILYDV